MCHAELDVGCEIKKPQHTNETKKKEFPSIIDSKGGQPKYNPLESQPDPLD